MVEVDSWQKDPYKMPCFASDIYSDTNERGEGFESMGAMDLTVVVACTSMCRHIYSWYIVDCDVKQPNWKKSLFWWQVYEVNTWYFIQKAVKTMEKRYTMYARK